MLKEDGHVEGVPDIVIEVLSPHSRTYDRRTKLDMYFRAGVPEYWIVDPENRTVTIYVRRGETFPGVEIGEDDNIRSEVLPDFHAPVASLFAR